MNSWGWLPPIISPPKLIICTLSLQFQLMSHFQLQNQQDLSGKKSSTWWTTKPSPTILDLTKWIKVSTSVKPSKEWNENNVHWIGAECAGKLLVDFTGLRDTGKLPLPVGPGRGGRGKKHYRIEFEIVPTIHGRNLRFEVKYPRGGAVQQTGQICIAATFEPGTG